MESSEPPGDAGADPELQRAVEDLFRDMEFVRGPVPWPITRPEQMRALRLGHAVLWRGAGDVVRLTGSDRLDLLQRLSASDLRHAKTGDVVATVFTNDKGRLVDVAMTAVTDDALWLVAGQGGGARLTAWLERFVIMEDVHVDRRPSRAVNTWITTHPGPPAPGAWQVVGDGWMMIREPAPWGGLVHAIGGAPEPPFAASIARCAPWDGHQGVEAAAFDQWCIEVGRLRPGPDLDEALNPLEAGLAGWVSLDKGCFIGQEVIARLANYDKIRRRLVRLAWTGAVPPKGAALTCGGRPAGFVVSAVARVDAPGNLALAVVLRELPIGTQLELPDGSPAAIEALFCE